MNRVLLNITDSDPAMTPPAPAPERASTTIDLGALLAALRRHWSVVLSSVVVSLGLGVAYLVTAPRSYMAITQVMIGEEVAGAASGINRPTTLVQSEVMLESALKLLQSQALALAVVDALDLHQHPAIVAPDRSLPARAAAWLRDAVASLLPAAGLPDLEPDPETEMLRSRLSAAAALSDDIDVRREGRSAVFRIRFFSTDPVLAADVVNAYAQAFVSDQLIGNVEASARVLDWLQDRLQVIQQDATMAALQAEEFRARSGLMTVSGETLAMQTIAALNTDLSAATVQLTRARALASVYAALKDLDPARFVETGAAGARLADAAEVADGHGRLQALLQRREDVERERGRDHVEVARLTTRIEAEARALQRQMERLHATALNEVQALEAEVDMLQASLAEISEANLRNARARVELQSLERQAETFEALNETYLLRLRDLEQTQTFPVTNVRVLSQANVPEDAVAPRRSLVMAAMLLLGGIAGGGLAVWRDRRLQAIRSREDVQEVSGLPFFGYLPQLTQEEIEAAVPAVPAARPRGRGRGKPRNAFEHGFNVLQHPHSQFTETMRAIRIGCEPDMAERAGHVVGVISLLPGEGKTTVAANLAAMMAVSGRSVLLVDADLRTSGLTRSLRQGMGIGLRNVLQERTAWRVALRQEQNTGLHLLPSNFPLNDPDAGNIAATSGFRELIAEARMDYGLTVIDLAPLGPVSDARALLPVIDGLVMVVEWGRIRRDVLAAALGDEPMVYDRLLGITLNKTDMRALGKFPRADVMGGYPYVEPTQAG